MKYVVEVTETLVKHVIVEAESEGDAEIIANDAYNQEQFMLTAEDYLDTEFKCLREANWSDIGEYTNI